MTTEKVICPKCKRQLKNINAWHYCVEVSIDDVFKGKKDEVILFFDTLLMNVAHWEDVTISATKNCIVFVRNKTFLVAKPMTKCLEIKLYMEEETEDDIFHKCALWGSKYEAIIRLENENDLTDKVMKYIKKSYEIS